MQYRVVKCKITIIALKNHSTATHPHSPRSKKTLNTKTTHPVSPKQDTKVLWNTSTKNKLLERFYSKS